MLRRRLRNALLVALTSGEPSADDLRAIGRSIAADRYSEHLLIDVTKAAGSMIHRHLLKSEAEENEKIAARARQVLSLIRKTIDDLEMTPAG